MTKILLIVLIGLLAFTLRVWNVDKNPAGLYYDEIDAGYQARSILETGKDYRGSMSPFFVNSFLDPRPPIPVYLTVFSTALFNSPELQVRMGSVIVGSINVLLVFILLWIWTKNYLLSLIGMIVTATNPWWIQFSRYNHEANTTVFFPLVGIICFLIGLQLKKFRYIWISVVFIALGIYTYRTMSLLAPFLIGCLIFGYFNFFKQLSWKQKLLLFITFLSITLSLILSTTIFAKDKPRIAQIAIFVDQSIPILIQRERELDSGDILNPEVGKSATFFSKIFHNKLDSFFSTFVKNYYSAFSTDFLFVHGDKNHRHSIEGQGMLLYTDIILLGFGIYYLFKNRHQNFSKFILAIFFLTPIPSALTQDGNSHASRMFLYSLPLLLIISYGWYFFYQSVNKLKIGNLLIPILLSFYLVLFVFYLHEYHTHFAIDSGRWHSSPYKQAMQEIMRRQGTYDHIVMVPHPDPPNLYLLFWGNIPPSQVQAFGSNFNEPKNDGSFLDRFKIADLPKTTSELIKVLQPKTLYLVTQEELREDLREGKKPPAGIDLLDIITYPDKEVAFYLIQKSDTVSL